MFLYIFYMRHSLFVSDSLCAKGLGWWISPHEIWWQETNMFSRSLRSSPCSVFYPSLLSFYSTLFTVRELGDILHQKMKMMELKMQGKWLKRKYWQPAWDDGGCFGHWYHFLRLCHLWRAFLKEWILVELQVFREMLSPCLPPPLNTHECHKDFLTVNLCVLRIFVCAFERTNVQNSCKILIVFASNSALSKWIIVDSAAIFQNSAASFICFS